MVFQYSLHLWKVIACGTWAHARRCNWGRTSLRNFRQKQRSLFLSPPKRILRITHDVTCAGVCGKSPSHSASLSCSGAQAPSIPAFSITYHWVLAILATWSTVFTIRKKSELKTRKERFHRPSGTFRCSYASFIISLEERARVDRAHTETSATEADGMFKFVLQPFYICFQSDMHLLRVGVTFHFWIAPSLNWAICELARTGLPFCVSCSFSCVTYLLTLSLSLNIIM